MSMQDLSRLLDPLPALLRRNANDWIVVMVPMTVTVPVWVPVPVPMAALEIQDRDSVSHGRIGCTVQ